MTCGVFIGKHQLQSPALVMTGSFVKETLFNTLNGSKLCQLQVFGNGTFWVSAFESLVLYALPVRSQSYLQHDKHLFLIAFFLNQNTRGIRPVHADRQVPHVGSVRAESQLC